MSTSATQNMNCYKRFKCPLFYKNKMKIDENVQEAVPAHILPQLQGNKQVIEGLCN